ncbi:MAG: hypothetical protein GY718_14015 [Lentisphaerae bacterium]|nr:hypothetical protein [Lentisphaerota bacterium]
MEPVTISILAPLLIPYAVKTVKGAARTVPCWINAATQIINIFRLPLVSLGLPFALVGYVVGNIAKGTMAPFLFVKEVLCLPLYFFGMA